MRGLAVHENRLKRGIRALGHAGFHVLGETQFLERGMLVEYALNQALLPALLELLGTFDDGLGLADHTADGGSLLVVDVVVLGLRVE